MSFSIPQWPLKSAFKSGLGLTIALSLSGCATLKVTKTPKTARNIILFIGDGMGISTITAARIFDGQSRGLKGEENILAFEDFEHIALIKTYNTNAQVPDSAGTATAIMSGYNTTIGTINVEADKSFQGCGDNPAPPTLTARAKAAGKAVGIVTTTRLTHATPAAMYGHADSRSWESDKDMTESDEDMTEEALAQGCKSLAAQMLLSQADLMLGGGHGKFTPAQINTLQASHTYVTTKDEMLAAPKTGTLRGLFTKEHMAYEADRNPAIEPSLAEMTTLAIERLSGNKEGYVLMVEAGRVDHAHHESNAYRALTDMQALNKAVKAAKDISGEETLILVTADHSHVFTIAGYPVRGNPILGLVRNIDPATGLPAEDYALAEDGKPYTTLGYHNGPHLRHTYSPALTENGVRAKDYHQEAAIPLEAETHAGEDVPLYARGPGAERVRGVMEQEEIFRVMASAMGWE